MSNQLLSGLDRIGLIIPLAAIQIFHLLFQVLDQFRSAVDRQRHAQHDVDARSDEILADAHGLFAHPARGRAGGGEIVTTTSYGYAPARRILSPIETRTVNSNGDTIRQTVTHPFDHTGTVYNGMKDAHILSPVITQTTRNVTRNTDIQAIEILDSRGNPTLEVEVYTESGSYGHGNGDPPVAITQALTIAEEDSDHFHFSSFQGIPTLRTDATSPSTLDTSVDVYLNVGNDFVPETAEKIIVSIDYVAIGSQYADANAPYGYVNNGGRLYEAFNFSETVDIQDDDQWEITASVTDDEALEPCTWIPGNQRRGAFELRKDRGENCEDSPVATTVEFTLGGSASESGLPRGYYLTTAVE